MIVHSPHPWNVTYKEAIKIQEKLREQLIFDLPFNRPKTVAGMDVSVSRKSTLGWAAVVVLSYPQLQVIEETWAKGKIDFPYIPGLLSFREIPLLTEALRELKTQPDVFMCDGQGIAHPRQMGLACHIGIIIKRPTIGCAKTRLVGEYSEPAPEKGQHAFLLHEGKVVGAVLRTRAGTKPVFVSPGYGLSLQNAIEVVLSCCTKYRIPEPIRAAHRLVNQLRKDQGGG